LQRLQNQLSQAQAKRWAQSQRGHEIREAREIQDNLLPKELPQVADYEVAAMTQPLRFVGGDYYNAVRLRPQHTMVCIGDVAGKGMPAALLRAGLQQALQPLLGQWLAAGELVHGVN